MVVPPPGRSEMGCGCTSCGPASLECARYARRRDPARPGVSCLSVGTVHRGLMGVLWASTRAQDAFGHTMCRNVLFSVNGPPAGQDVEVRGPGRGRKWMDETDVPTQRAQARQDPRIPQADVDQSRSSRDQGSPREGAAAPVGVSSRENAQVTVGGIGPVRSSRTFGALHRSSCRGRSGPVSVNFVARPDWTRSEVAYALNRKVGGAVVRNRLRRRMRAILGEQAVGLPAGAYLVKSAPDGAALDFDELRMAMSRAVEQATSRPVIGSRGQTRRSRGPAR